MSWRVLRCEEALAADKTIDCWGGNNIWSNIDYGLTDAPDGQYTAIAAGWDHSCAIAADNTIDCWGDNRYGQANVPVPVFDASAEGIAVAPGGTVACTVAWNGEPELVCSGGQAGGDGTSPDDAQTNMASLNGTVSAPSGVSTDDVVVSVVAFCWGGCDGGGQPGGSAERPRGLDPAEFLAETGVDSSGRWSVAVPEPQSQDLNALWLLVWDEGGVLAPHYRFVWVLWPDVEFGDIDIGDADVELEAGGRVTGRFSTPDGRPPPSGDYALWGSGDWLLDVDPQTGEFTSPVVAPGDYSLAHGNHVEGHLTNNAAAEVEVAAGQTADAGTVRVQQLGQITVAIAYSDGQPIQGVAVSGRITSQNPYQSMPPSPFSTTGTGFFSAANDDDGTLTAQGLYPGEDWQITMVIPTGGQYTAIAAGGEHTCAIAADQTIDCWGGNDYGQADAPDGQYTAIATGSLQTCAIAADQTIDCWGRNDYGEADAPGGRYTAIAAGDRHSCAIAVDQTIDCWGSNLDGEADAPGGQYTAIATGLDHTCAIAVDQTIDCWGSDLDGEADAPGGQYTAIATGGFHTCAIAVDQTIDCWGSNLFGHTDAPGGQYTAIATGGGHSCAIAVDQTIDCWGRIDSGQATPTESTTLELEGVAVGSGGTTTVHVTVSDSGVTTTDVSRTSDEDDSDETATDDPSDTGGGEGSGGTETEGDGEDSGETATDGPSDTGDGEDSGEAEPEDGGAAVRCFEVHRFGAEPVDVAKSADGEAVLAQLSWGYHDSIGCYLTLDEDALGVLQAAAAPEAFPAGNAEAAQQCSAVHKFGAQPVDVAKSADRQTVLAQVSWGYHESFGCYLALDPAATAALRAAHT